jgi:hypothetical protein
MVSGAQPPNSHMLAMRCRLARLHADAVLRVAGHHAPQQVLARLRHLDTSRAGRHSQNDDPPVHMQQSSKRIALCNSY